MNSSIAGILSSKDKQRWTKLDKEKQRLTIYTSTDGQKWTKIDKIWQTRREKLNAKIRQKYEKKKSCCSKLIKRQSCKSVCRINKNFNYCRGFPLENVKIVIQGNHFDEKMQYI